MGSLSVTRFDTETGVATPLDSDKWVTIFSKENISKITKLKAVEITITGGDPTELAYRIRGCVTGGTKEKFFPYGASKPFISGEEKVFAEPVVMGKNYDYDVQVYCADADAASATLSSLKIIELGDCAGTD